MHMSLADNYESAYSITIAALTVTANGTAIRTGRAGHARAAEVHLGTWTDGTFTLTFQDSDDNSTWTTLGSATDQTPFDDPDSRLSGATNSIVISDNTRAGLVLKVGLLSIKDYIRCVDTVSGGPGTGAIFGVAIKTGKLRSAGPTII